MNCRSFKYAIALLLTAGAVAPVYAKWLPAERKSGVRLLDCRYDRQYLKDTTQIESSRRWHVEPSQSTRKFVVPALGDSATAVTTTYQFIALEDMEQSGVAVAHDFSDWSSDNYVMIPASVYNGNRQRIVNRSYATGLDPAD